MSASVIQNPPSKLNADLASMAIDFGRGCEANSCFKQQSRVGLGSHISRHLQPTSLGGHQVKPILASKLKPIVGVDFEAGTGFKHRDRRGVFKTRIKARLGKRFLSSSDEAGAWLWFGNRCVCTSPGGVVGD
jgi:hypothetical protein